MSELRVNRLRSPNYPQISLPEAIDKIRALYKVLHTANANQRQVAERLGYGSLNGRSQGVISALRKYGLLEGRGDNLNVSPEAVIIIERQEDHPDRQAAIRQAALAPPLFAELYEEFEGLTPSDTDFRISLVKKGFSRKAVADIIGSYRDTIALVTAEGEVYTEPEMKESRQEPEVQRLSPAVLRSLAEGYSGKPILAELNNAEGQQPIFTEELNYRISDESKVRVGFTGRITQEAIDKLIRHLELAKEDYPSRRSLRGVTGIGRLFDREMKFLFSVQHRFVSENQVMLDPSQTGGDWSAFKETPELLLEREGGQWFRLFPLNPHGGLFTFQETNTQPDD